MKILWSVVCALIQDCGKAAAMTDTYKLLATKYHACVGNGQQGGWEKKREIVVIFDRFMKHSKTSYKLVEEEMKKHGINHFRRMINRWTSSLVSTYLPSPTHAFLSPVTNLTHVYLVSSLQSQMDSKRACKPIQVRGGC